MQFSHNVSTIPILALGLISVWKVLLKISISLVLIGVIFHEINFQVFAHYLLTIHVSWYLLAIALQIFSCCIAAYKWDVVMRSMHFNASFRFYLRTYFIGALCNQVLPTSVGGDAVRIAYAKKLGSGLRQAFNGVMVDRYYGTAGLVLINLSLLNWLYHIVPRNIFVSIISILGIVLFALFFGLITCKIHFLKNFKITQFIYDLSQAILISARSPKRLIVLLLLAILSNLLCIGGIYCIAIALDLPISLMSLLGIMPAVTLITLLPLSFAGWGLREGAMVTFLLFLGVPKAGILSLSVLYGISLILASLPGLYCYLFDHKRKLI